MSSLSFDFPQPLSEKYRPMTIGGFVGLDKPRAIMRKLAAQPFSSAWLFVGPSGTGKSSLGLALAEEMPAELHHIPSQSCNVAALEAVRRTCQYVPRAGCRMHLVLVDEADQMSPAAQLALLSMTDSTNPAPDTIWIFTCNSTERLEDRFLSRCRVLEFSSYGISKDATALLERIWKAEYVGSAPAPNFQRIVKEANNNVRAALMGLEVEIMGAL
jgi:replication-associated recombination protein RarA